MLVFCEMLHKQNFMRTQTVKNKREHCWAPSYMRKLCRPLSSCAGHRTLWFSVRGNLVVTFARSATMQTRSFSVFGPTTWNGLPIDLRYLPNGACSQFHHLLKTVLFRLAWIGSASE